MSWGASCTQVGMLRKIPWRVGDDRGKWCDVSPSQRFGIYPGLGGLQFCREMQFKHVKTWRWKWRCWFKSPSCVGFCSSQISRTWCFGVWVMFSRHLIEPCRSQASQTCSERDGHAHVIEVEKEGSFWSLQMNMLSQRWVFLFHRIESYIEYRLQSMRLNVRKYICSMCIPLWSFQ